MSLAAAATVMSALATGGAANGLTDYEAERGQLERQIAEHRRAPSTAAPASTPTRLAVLLYRRASLSSDFSELREAEVAIDDALRLEPAPELYLLRAKFNLKVHRLRRARADLGAVSELARTTPARLVAAQISEQEGDYAAAGRAYEAAARDVGSWDALAGLAHWQAHLRSPADADATYVLAGEQVTAKHMRDFAWIEVQRGILDFERGRYDDALTHYRKADRAYSGYWLVEEHIAEVLARQGRSDDAARLYRSVVDRTRNPELMSALAALVADSHPAEASALADTAGALYERQFSLYPEAAASHLVRHWLGRPDPPLDRLAALARLNAEARPHADAKALLARVLWRTGDPVSARRQAAEVLRTPWRSAEIAALRDDLRSERRGRAH